jgi:hypothetical protein
MDKKNKLPFLSSDLQISDNNTITGAGDILMNFSLRKRFHLGHNEHLRACPGNSQLCLGALPGEEDQE